MSEQIEAEDFIKPEVTAKEKRLFKEAGDKVVKALDWMSNSGVESAEKDAELITSFIKGNTPGSLGLHLTPVEGQGYIPPFQLEWSERRKEMVLIGMVDKIVNESMGSIILDFSHEAEHVRQTLAAGFRKLNSHQKVLVETGAFLHELSVYEEIKGKLNRSDDIHNRLAEYEKAKRELSPQQFAEVMTKAIINGVLNAYRSTQHYVMGKE